jgi:hypothetical protein
MAHKTTMVSLLAPRRRRILFAYVYEVLLGSNYILDGDVDPLIPSFADVVTTTVLVAFAGRVRAVCRASSDSLQWFIEAKFNTYSR